MFTLPVVAYILRLPAPNTLSISAHHLLLYSVIDTTYNIHEPRTRYNQYRGDIEDWTHITYPSELDGTETDTPRACSCAWLLRMAMLRCISASLRGALMEAAPR